MNEERKIVIVEDDGKMVKFQDVVITNDEIDREEVAQVKDEIARLEQDKIAIDDKLISLKAKLLYAEKVIAIADAEKAAKETAEEEQVETSEVVENEPATDETVVEGV